MHVCAASLRERCATGVVRIVLSPKGTETHWLVRVQPPLYPSSCGSCQSFSTATRRPPVDPNMCWFLQHKFIYSLGQNQLTLPLSSSSFRLAPKMAEDYRVYPKRWLYLFVACLVNFSNGNTWITYAAITFYTNDYYNNNNAALLFNVIFMVLSIPVGFLACWWIDKFGLRSAYHIGAWANFIGNVVRLVGSGTFIDPAWRFPIAFAGQTIAAVAQPFVMFLPTKLAAYWFAEDERGIANTLASMSNPIGIAAMYSLAPVFINNSTPDNFFNMNIAITALATLTVLFTFFLTTSKPPTPASPSRDDDVIAPPFFQGVKMCFRSKTFIILAICLGGGVGLFNALYNNLQPALCVKGYSPTFNGGMGSLLIMSGLVGAAITGIIVDKWGQFEKVMKISFCIAGVAASSLTIVINYSGVQWWVVLSIFIFGAAGFSIYPIGLEMGVEATFPVAEATSTGLIIMIGQIQGVVYVILTNLATGKPTPADLAVQTCVDTNQNLKTVFDVEMALYHLARVHFRSDCGFSLCCFWPKYKRRNYEQGRKTEATRDTAETMESTYELKMHL
ncbi:unnamed protein product [Caenorhabditis auriculariae]|uniref:Major facilitator superfamily (MFS) profile domain-containing protein n=1 Tax=Caenorhabditis auriculariae TaxID=2777116 RepID=A0A8S1GRP1_9PELO|nr:unnamed protein product [Caenorhabditis auriculariae]